MKTSEQWYTLKEGINSHNQSTPSLDKAIALGKEYFSLVLQFANLLGDSKRSVEASEVFFLIAFFDRKYINRTKVELFLSLDRSSSNRSIKFLKDKGLIKSYKKGLTVNWGMPCFDNEENAWKARIITSYALEWYSNWDDHWILVEFINIIQNLMGIDIPKSSRRLFAKCICFECIDGCSAPTARKLKKELLTLNRSYLEELIVKKNYRSNVDMELEVGRTKRMALSSFQKAKMALKDNGNYYGISDWERKVAERAKELYPDDYKAQCLFVYTIIVSLGYIDENTIVYGKDDDCKWNLYFGKTREEKKKAIWEKGVQKSLYELSKDYVEESDNE